VRKHIAEKEMNLFFSHFLLALFGLLHAMWRRSDWQSAYYWNDMLLVGWGKYLLL